MAVTAQRAGVGADGEDRREAVAERGARSPVVLRGRTRLMRRVWISLAAIALVLGLAPPASAAVSAIAFHRTVPFVENVEDLSGIWAMPAAGGEPTLLVKGGVLGDFSPDGSKIVYLQNRSGGGVAVANIDGTSETTLLFPTVIAGGLDFGPGNLIAFATETNGGNNANAIRVMNADGSNVHSVFTAPTSPSGHDLSSPSFSPNGAQIVFKLVNFEFFMATEGLWIVDSDGSDPHQVTSFSGDGDAEFSPDGARIAFTRFLSIGGGESQADLFVINANGTGATNITNTPGVNETEAAYSPDGARIAYTARPGIFEDEHIEIIGADGSNRVDLTSSVPGAETNPTWANVAALPPPPGAGGAGSDAACERAREKLAKAKKTLKKLRQNDASKNKVKRAKKKVKRAKKKVNDAC